MSTDVSIIVPVYNTEKYLRECLDSIIAQTIFDRLEIILVDDGSTDNSPAICDEYAAEFNSIFVIHQKNSGVSAARNAGIGKAGSEFIGFVDSDDFLFPRMYEMLLNAAKTVNTEMSFCDYIYCSSDCETEITFPFAENTVLDKDYIRDIIYAFLLSEGSLNTCCNKLFRRKLIDNNGMKFEAGRKIGEDRLFTIAYLSKCSGVCYVRYSGYFYRFVSGSATKAPRKALLDDIINEYKEDLKIFKALDVGMEKIDYYSGLKLLGQALAGLHLAAENMTGKDRLTAVRKIISNREIRNCLKKRRNSIAQNCSSYDKTLYFLIRLKSGLGLITLMRLMHLKTSLHRGKTK